MATLAETLTKYFYLWEERGRGWYAFDHPVPLEPPFTPFYPQPAIPVQTEDDGRHATYLHFLFRKLFPKKKVDAFQSLALPVPKPISNTELAIFGISLPRSLDLFGYESEQLLLLLSYCKHPISFEVIGTHQKISIQIACSDQDKEYVINQFKAFYPTCTILPCQDALNILGSTGQDTLFTEFGLTDEFMRPLAFRDAKEPSLYVGMKGLFEVLQTNECVCIQLLFQGASHPWTKSILSSVSNGHGRSFFENAPEMPKLAQSKVSSQLFGVVVRVLVSAQNSHRAGDLIGRTGNALIGQTRSQWNSLMALSEDSHDAPLHTEDVFLRRSRRYGMLLNTEELSRMVHIPDEEGLVGALSNTKSKTKPIPAEVQNHAHVLGINEHMGVKRTASVDATQRFTHMHVIGATGTGKSTFLLNSIVQDIQNGNGIAVLDPHGDLIESVLNFIPEHRLRDVILIDPSDTEYSVGFNILKANTELEKDVLSSDLVSVFQRFATSWGDQMTSVLANTLLAFLESSQGGTLLDVRRFLLEPTFRASVLKTVSDPSILYYWNKEFPILKSTSIGPILTRLDSFLRPKAIRYMLAQKDGLNFDNIINSQKILLVKLSHGLIGEGNSYLLGSLLVSKIYQTALARQSTGKGDRKDFFVYIDEFQHYITPSLSNILSGGRKYRLGLVLAHQSLEQISNASSELASSLTANAGIRVCFRLGESDAQKLAKGFASFTEEDLLNLSTGETICRIGRTDLDFNVKISKDALTSQDFMPIDAVIKASREKYGVLRSSLERFIGPQIDATEGKDDEPIREVKMTGTHLEKPIVQVQQVKPVEVPKTESIEIQDPSLVRDIVRRKEESKHKYLQMLIKRNAESRGYKATLEQPTKDGNGRIDVVLQKDKIVYAIEVGATTTKEWEVHNIEKCLADGYSNIIALSEDIKGADLMTRKLTESNVLPNHLDKVRVYDLMGFMGVLDKEDVSKNTKVKKMKGYRIKITYGGKA